MSSGPQTPQSGGSVSTTPTLNHLLRMPAPQDRPEAGEPGRLCAAMNQGQWAGQPAMPPPACPPNPGQHRSVAALKGQTNDLRSHPASPGGPSPGHSPAPNQSRHSPVSPAPAQYNSPSVPNHQPHPHPYQAGPPPQQQGPLPQHQGPPQHFQGAPHHQGPPQHQGPPHPQGPPQQQGPPQYQGPPQHQGPPHQQGPSQHAGPPQQQGPSQHAGPPQQQGPVAHQGHPQQYAYQQNYGTPSEHANPYLQNGPAHQSYYAGYGQRPQYQQQYPAYQQQNQWAYGGYPPHSHAAPQGHPGPQAQGHPGAQGHTGPQGVPAARHPAQMMPSHSDQHVAQQPAQPQVNGPVQFPQNSPQPSFSHNKPQKTKDSSMPSTPGTPANANNTTNEDSLADSSGMASPAWTQNAPSPVVRQRTPGPESQQLTPKPANIVQQTQQVPHDIVERLAGNPSHYPPQEYQRRIDFYKSLCTFLTRKGEPLTGPPQVSKQTVDLYAFYYAVHDKGGFEMVMKTKAWKQLCPIVPALQESSAAGYQLRKHYAKFLLEFECHFSPRGRSAAELIDMAEKQKKTKVRKRDRQSPDGPDTPGPTGQSAAAAVPAGYQADGNGQFVQANYGNVPPNMEGHWMGQPQGMPWSAQQQQQQRYPPTGPAVPPQQEPRPGPGPLPAQVPPPSSQGDMIARDPFDDRNGPVRQPPSQHAAAGTYYPPYQGTFVRPVMNPAVGPGQYGVPRPSMPYPVGHPGYRPTMGAGQQVSRMFYQSRYPVPHSDSGGPAQAATPPYVQQTSAPPSTQPVAWQPTISGVAGQPTRFGTPTTGYDKAALDGRGDSRSVVRTPQTPQNYYQSRTFARDMRHAGHRRDAVQQSQFPPGCVEATACSTRRRRKLVAKDVGKLDPWRLVMALKSGLQAEICWALNILNILLYDDSTVAYFGLKNLPGLLEVVIELFRRSLCEVFPEEEFGLIEQQCVTPFPDAESKVLSVESALVHFALPHATNCLKRAMTDTDRLCGKTMKHCKVELQCCDAALPPPQTHTVDNTIKNGFLTGASWDMGGGMTTQHLATKFNPDAFLDFKRPKCEDSEVPVCKKDTVVWQCAENSQPQFFLSDCTEAKLTDPELKGNVKSISASALTNRNDFMIMNIHRCLALSNIIRGLSFVPGNEMQMCDHAGLIGLMGRLIRLHHQHLPTKKPQDKLVVKKEDTDKTDANIDEDKKRNCEQQLDVDGAVWECVLQLREDSLVVATQLSVQMDLMNLDELVVRSFLDSLIHWVVCPSHETRDPLPPGHISPQKYALETLCKMSVMENNVDLLLATPPWRRTERLVEVLASLLSLGEETTVREFALVLLFALCSGAEAVCAHTAMHTPAVHHLVSFIEEHDTNLHLVLNQRGMPALRENPELMGTSVGMLRRAAGTLHCLSKITACRDKFHKYQQRLLQFTMSQLMDSRVAAIIAETLYELQKANEAQVPAAVKPEETSSENSESTCVAPEPVDKMDVQEGVKHEAETISAPVMPATQLKQVKEEVDCPKQEIAKENGTSMPIVLAVKRRKEVELSKCVENGPVNCKTPQRVLAE